MKHMSIILTLLALYKSTIDLDVNCQQIMLFLSMHTLSVYTFIYGSLQKSKAWMYSEICREMYSKICHKPSNSILNTFTTTLPIDKTYFIYNPTAQNYFNTTRNLLSIYLIFPATKYEKFYF